jgi:hypothetical protein
MEERTKVAREVFLRQDVTAITVLLLHVKKARHSPYLINHRAAALTREQRCVMWGKELGKG